MKKETVHIISHSHWDREWYLPFESHRMKLVELIDDLFDIFESDPEFKSFHLDGQTIALDDYLAIRPHKKEQLEKYIREGKLKIGPFYILQDDYLISSEANMRNTLIGNIESKKWGTPPKIGYFPDTFGNMGQTPQLLKQANIDVALFGRGVKPVGFDNQVLSDDKFKSQFSEMNWIGADGTQVLGILFANWYSNGNEIPVEKETAKVFWDKKLADVRKYASTPHLLMMNGCDHQPVQKDVTQAIQTARELYPEIEFVHSNFEDYIKAVRESLPEKISSVQGELTSQETDGWYTLANTASSRIYLKQANDRASKLLEQVVEPLAVLTGGMYPKDELYYAWKLLLENSPHDSICGCSVDSVHREMEVRFEKVEQVGQYLADKLFKEWSPKVNTAALDGYLFTVFNTSSSVKTDLVTVDLTIDEVDFRDGRLGEHYKNMDNITLPTLGLFSDKGERIWADIEDIGTSFDYHLPNDAFRSAVFARKIRVTFVAKDLPAFSWQTYQVKPIDNQQIESTNATQYLENKQTVIKEENGKLVLIDKVLNHTIDDFIVFEDTGDIGNEYAYFAPVQSKEILSELVSFSVVEQTPEYQKARVIHQLDIPVSADDTLIDEQRRLVEYRHRQAQRSATTEKLLITTEITIFSDNPQIRFKSAFHNTMKDHRLRVVFKTGLKSETHLADSIYEVVSRNNTPADSWENPHHPQRHRSFIALQQENLGVSVGTVGLHEYEIIDNTAIAVTILRSVGELGDWGDFPTPEAQCLRESIVAFSFEIHQKEQFFDAVHRAKSLQIPLYVNQTDVHDGTINSSGRLTHHVLNDTKCYVTSLKQAEETQDKLIRYYNLSQDSIRLNYAAEGVNLLEEPIGELGDELGPQEIRTEILPILNII